MHKVLVLSGDPKFRGLGSLLRSRGADVSQFDGHERPTGAVDLAIIAPDAVDEGERVVSDLVARSGCFAMVVLPDADEQSVQRLYGAGAAVVFPSSVDLTHVYLQCRYFLELETQRAARVQFADAVLDVERRILTLPDRREVKLTEVEAKILRVLMDRPGRFVAKELISETVFSRAYDKFDRRIDVHVSNIRRKLRSGDTDLTILTSRLGGLKLAADGPDLSLVDTTPEPVHAGALAG